jgi:hypothetical protein
MHQVATRICKIEGCEKPVQAKGLCSMHYGRIRNGYTDMRPEPLPRRWKPDDSRQKGICLMPNCGESHYAKGYCRTHYDLNLRNGEPFYKREKFIACKVPGCNRRAKSLGFCIFHYTRYRQGIELMRPKGIKGELNPNWNGGVADYPSHSEMKRVRKQVLEEANWICHYCGSPANQIDHIDLSKDNHSKDNLVACCHKCNHTRCRSYTSKFKRLYGKTAKELGKELGISATTVIKKHKEGKLRYLLSPQEIDAVLF